MYNYLYLYIFTTYRKGTPARVCGVAFEKRMPRPLNMLTINRNKLLILKYYYTILFIIMKFGPPSVYEVKSNHFRNSTINKSNVYHLGDLITSSKSRIIIFHND